MSCNFLIKSNKEPLLLNTKKNNLPSLIWKKGKMLGTEEWEGRGGGGFWMPFLLYHSQQRVLCHTSPFLRYIIHPILRSWDHRPIPKVTINCLGYPVYSKCQFMSLHPSFFSSAKCQPNIHCSQFAYQFSVHFSCYKDSHGSSICCPT